MKLLEFFNEAQEVELKNPGTLQKVLDAFLSYTNTKEELPPEVEAAEARCAVLRSRLDQSKEAGLDKFGKTPGQYGRMNLDAEDMRAVALALKMVGEPRDAEKLKADLQGMRVEGLSGGFEGLGGHGEGFEVQNQGVTRRSPGEGPSTNGGRAQPQQMDSYDQPQFEPTKRFNIMRREAIGEEFMGVRDADTIETQDTHAGSQEAGPIAMKEVFGSKTVVVDPFRTDTKKLMKLVSPNSSLFWKIRQVRGPQPHGVSLNASEVEELRQALIPVSQDQAFDDIISQLHEAKIAGGRLDWQEQYRGAQFVAETEFGKWSVHQANKKWVHVFYPAEGLRVPYEDGYAPSPGHAMQECEKQYAALVKKQSEPEGTPGGPAGAQATAPMSSAWQGRKPLMNSYDRADEAADMKDVQHRMKKVSAKMDKLKKSSEKEKKEHPWASKKQAMQIAKDHEKLGEGVYRLTEFYVISPEGNGQGHVKKDGEPEPIAAGGSDELSAVMVQHEPEVPDLQDAIAQAFEQAVKDGSEVVFDPDEMTIKFVKKDDKEEE